MNSHIRISIKLLFVSFLTLFYLLAGDCSLQAQKALYPDQFPLQDVRLLDSPFKRAMDLNIQNLLKYNMARLLQPYYKQAGLDNGAEAFSNWAGLDGHVGGHYLSALAIHYAATDDPLAKGRLKARMDSMLVGLKSCQQAAVQLGPEMEHYLGGVPGSKNLWIRFANGDFSAYNQAWVPWYNVHKMFAGLRDAWLYAGDSTALEMFLDYCDWALAITSALSDAQMQTMLNTEHGGMNEVLADAYQLSGDFKYLNAAKRFTHQSLLNGMANENARYLDNLHANTQVPKFVGIQRIYELSPSLSDYARAAGFFWNDVAYHRSLALGGNSRNEHFIAPAACEDYVTYREGPETCNTYNMLKLTENLFRIRQEAAYADFYEQALYNHILSTQHPEHGGYVYFTSARPRHYRVYSQVNQAMWCCVGSGMENHGKYGQFIYTQRADSLYLNLFIPSQLNWREQGVIITQQTDFPYASSAEISVQIPEGGPRNFSLWLRHPYWADSSAYSIRINGEIMAHNSSPQSYVCISRSWQDGDVLSVELPMNIHFKTLPNVDEYLALMYGPVLLGAKVDSSGLEGLLAAEGRMDHVAEGPLLPLNQAPVLVGNRDSLVQAVHLVDSATLSFEVAEFLEANHDTTYKKLLLQPFYALHDARYMMYWMQLRPDEYQEIYELLAREEQERLALEARTVDQIATGEQQPDQNHNARGESSNVGVYQNTYYRDANQGGWFSYDMSTLGVDTLVLRATYWGYESGNRTFDILVEGDTIARENLAGKWNISEFRSVDYEIPVALTAGKSSIRVCFDALEGHTAGGLFHLRLMSDSGRAERLRYEQVLVADIDAGYSAAESKYKIFVSNSNTGSHQGESWRDAYNGGYIRYTIPLDGQDSMFLRVRYWGNEGLSREFDILVDEVVFASESLVGKWNVDAFQEVDYNIPSALFKGKSKINLKFRAKAGNYAGGLFYVWLYALQAREPAAISSVQKEEEEMDVSVSEGMLRLRLPLEEQGLNNRLRIFGMNGSLLYSSIVQEQNQVFDLRRLPRYQWYVLLCSNEKGSRAQKLLIP